MNTITLFRTRETPVEWRSIIPGIVLTAGMVNKVDLKLQDTPDVGDGATIEPGKLALTIRRMGDMSEFFLKITDIEIPAGSSSVKLEIPLQNDFSRGYYRLHVVQYNSSDEAVAVYNAWAVVDRSIEPLRDTHMELTSVRTQFSDLSGDDNKLLGSLEIGTGDIAEAVERCLEQWAATAPRTSRYYGDTFPYPELLRNGVLSMLLQSICTQLDRNRMTYQAEGVAVDLEKRVDIYRNLQMAYEARWRNGMMQMKNEENVNTFTGGLVY